MKIKILKAAKKDLKDGYNFYERQQSGIGAYFLETLFADIESLKLFSGIHNIHFKNYHRPGIEPFMVPSSKKRHFRKSS